METEIQKRHNDYLLSEIPILQGENGTYGKVAMSLLKNKNRAGIRSDICSLFYIPTRINSYGFSNFIFRFLGGLITFAESTAKFS